MEAASDEITGVPHAIDSSGGIPKPSYFVGKTNQLAPEYIVGRSSSSTNPVK